MSADLSMFVGFAIGLLLLGLWVVVGYGVGLREDGWRSVQSRWWRNVVVYGLPWSERLLPALPAAGLAIMLMTLAYALAGAWGESFDRFPLVLGQDIGVLGLVFLLLAYLCFVFCPRWVEPAWHRDARLGIAVPPIRPMEFRLTRASALWMGATLLGALVATPVLGFFDALAAAFVVTSALGLGFRLLQRLRG